MLPCQRREEKKKEKENTSEFYSLKASQCDFPFQAQRSKGPCFDISVPFTIIYLFF